MAFKKLSLENCPKSSFNTVIQTTKNSFHSFKPPYLSIVFGFHSVFHSLKCMCPCFWWEFLLSDMCLSLPLGFELTQDHLFSFFSHKFCSLDDGVRVWFHKHLNKMCLFSFRNRHCKLSVLSFLEKYKVITQSWPR